MIRDIALFCKPYFETFENSTFRKHVNIYSEVALVVNAFSLIGFYSEITLGRRGQGGGCLLECVCALGQLFAAPNK